MPVSLNYEICRYIEHLRVIGRADTTIASYRRELLRLSDWLGNPESSAVEPESLEKALRFFTGQRKASQRKLEGATINRIKSTYRSFFGWLSRSGRIPFNPAAELYLGRFSSQPTLPITISQTERFLETIRRSNDSNAGRDEALFAVYAFTGLRRNEVLALRVFDFNYETQNLSVKRLKRSGFDVIPAPPVLADILGRHIQKLGKRFGQDSTQFMFQGRDPKRPLTPRQVQARFDHWKRAAGLNPCLRIHSFRAGYATAVYHHTGDILFVSRLLGHGNVQTTQRYVGICEPYAYCILADVFG